MVVRMKDIAQDLGVSLVTVSKVLRNHPDISEETRQRVLRRMEERNYRPNLAARALVTGKTHLMGLVVPTLLHSFFAEVAHSISSVVRKKGYGLVISSSEEDAELEMQEIDQLLARSVDCLFVASAQWTVEGFRRIEERKTPYVLIDRKFVGLPANFVGLDDERLGSMATEHLIEVGCRRIAHIGAPYISTAIGRFEGYRRALHRHGMQVPSEYYLSEPYADDSGDVIGYDMMRSLLKLTPSPDGVFCHNDPIAFGAMKAVLDAGLRIPEDIAIIGCGNVRHSDRLRVPLSTIDQNSAAIGERAAKLALSLMESKTPLRPETILLEPKLVVRDSTRRAASAVRTS